MRTGTPRLAPIPIGILAWGLLLLTPLAEASITITQDPPSTPVAMANRPYSLTLDMATDGVSDTVVTTVTVVNGDNAGDSVPLAEGGALTSADNGGIPPGMTVERPSPGLVTIGETPTIIGTYKLKFAAEGNGGGTATKSITINVVPRTQFTFNGGGPAAVPVADPTVPANAQNFVIMYLDVQIAGTDINGLPEPVKIKSLKFDAFGTGDDAGDISSISLYADVGSAAGSVDANDLFLGSSTFGGDDGTATISGNPLRTVPGQTTDEQWLVVYSFSGTADNGKYFVCNISPGSNANNATGLFSGVTFSAAIENPAGTRAVLQSNTMTIQTPAGLDEILVTNLGGPTNVANNPAGVPATGEDNVEMLSFRLTGDGDNDGLITLDRIQFTANGSGTDTLISGARLYQDAGVTGTYDAGDDTQIATSSAPFSQDNGTLTFSGLAESFAAAASQDYLLVFDFATTDSTTSRDFQAVLAAPAAIDGDSTSPAAGSPITVNLVAFGGGLKTQSAGTGGSAAIDLTVSVTTANPSAQTVTGTATGVAAVHVALEANSSTNVKVTTFVVRAAGTGDDVLDLSSAKLYYDRDGDAVVDSFDTLLGTTTFSQDNGIATFAGLTQVISAGQTQNWLVTYDFNNAPDTIIPALDYQALVSQDSDVVAVDADTTASAGVTVASAPIAGGLITLGTTSGSNALLVRASSGNPPSSTVRGAETNMPMLGIELEANTTVSVKVNTITINSTGSGNEDEDVSGVTLIHDRDGDGIKSDGDLDIATGSFNVDEGSVTFSAGWIISAGTTQKWIVLFDFSAAEINPPLTFRASLQSSTNVTAEDASTAGGVGVSVTGAPILGGTMSIGDAEEIGGTPGTSAGTSTTGGTGGAGVSTGGPVDRGHSSAGCVATAAGGLSSGVATLLLMGLACMLLAGFNMRRI